MVAVALVAELLGRTTLFGSLKAGDRDHVARRMKPQSYLPGQALFRHGDPGHCLFLIGEGSVRLTVLSSTGREISFTQADRGAIVGEIAALGDVPRTAGATAVTKVSALALDRSELREIMSRHPEVADGAIRMLCTRLQAATDQLETVALHPVEVRLARFLLARARRSRRSGPRVAIELGVSKSDLALFINVSRPKLSGAFAALEGRDAIRRTGRRIECDVGALQRIVDAG